MSTNKHVADRGTRTHRSTLSSSSADVPQRVNKPYYENSRHSWVFTKAPPAPEALTSSPSFYSPSFDGLPEDKTSPTLSPDSRRSSASNLKELKLKDDLSRKRAPSNLRNVTLPSQEPTSLSTANTTGNNSQRNSVTSSNRDSVSSDMGYFSTSPGSEPGKVAPAILNQLARINMIPQEVFSRHMDPSPIQNLVSPPSRPYSEEPPHINEDAATTSRSSPYLTPLSFSPTASFSELPNGPFSPGFNSPFPSENQFKKAVESTSGKHIFNIQKVPTKPKKETQLLSPKRRSDKRDSGNQDNNEVDDCNSPIQHGSPVKASESRETIKEPTLHRSSTNPMGSRIIPVPIRSTTFPAPISSTSPRSFSDPLLQRRMNIAFEILHTERTYVAGLELIERVFYRPLIEASQSSSPILDAKRISDIFANLMGILTVNREFLSQLELRLEGGDAPWSPETDLVGDIFCQMAPYFRMYSLYVKNFNSALSVISDQMGKSASFAAFLKGKNVIEQCKGLAFESYLILPVQRIPRYKLLIEDLLKRTDPSHLDYNNLEKGLDIVQRVAIFVNETIRQHEMFMEMLKIQNSLTGFSEVLLVPGRRLIKRGPVHKICRKNHQLREFFLFTDLLVYASGGPAPEVPLTFHRKVELDQSKVVDVADTDQIKNSFQIINPEKSFAVYCDSTEEKERWVSMIRDTIEDLLSSKRTLRLSAAQPPRRAAEVVLPQVISNYQAPVWIPDDQAVNCHTCREEFTVFRRKHHCRLCGNVICHACSANTFFIPGSSLADLRPARACDLCYRSKFPGAAINSALASKRSSFMGDSAAPSSVASVSRFPFNAPRRLAELRDSFVSRDSYCSDTSTLDGGDESNMSSGTSTFTRLQRLRSVSGTSAKSCQLCLSEFTVFKWKNQCLSCRKVICSDCLSKKAKARAKRESILVTSVASIVATMSSDAASLAETHEHVEEEEESSLCDPCYLGVDPSHVIVNPEGGGWGVHESASLGNTVAPSSTNSGITSATITSANSSEAINEKSIPAHRPSQLAKSTTS